MIILLLGSGGREHAIARKIAQSKKCTKLFIAPGNAGTSSCGENVSLKITDFTAIRDFVLREKVELIVIGPEEPLVKGITNFFKNDKQVSHVPVLGPSSEGAKLEGSKDYAKAFMQRHGIPTAAYRTFAKNEVADAGAFLESLQSPYVLKADGLAAGKGVIISESLQDAKESVNDMLAHARFGSAGDKVVIEEFLPGIELSVFVLTDGNTYKILPEAKDYKRIGDNDTGPNTGGMGAVSPVPFADNAFMKKVEERIIVPTINGLRKEGIDYRGFVFIGLMNVDGNPFVIEYNVRMGDPETEVVFPRIASDIVDLLYAAATGNLKNVTLETDSQTAVTVVMVSGGYPGDYKTGEEIQIDGGQDESIIFHAGTKTGDGRLVTSGGRVFAITSLGATVDEALRKSYRTINRIKFNNSYYRKDIGNEFIRQDEK